jgi:hypothetical protein
MSLRARAARLPPRLRDDQTIVDFAELDSEGEEEAMDADEAYDPEGWRGGGADAPGDARARRAPRGRRASEAPSSSDGGEEYAEADLSRMSPESRRRARRRIANRECARRIRERKLVRCWGGRRRLFSSPPAPAPCSPLLPTAPLPQNLHNRLAGEVAALEARGAALAAELAAATARWRAVAVENCLLEAELALAQLVRGRAAPAPGGAGEAAAAHQLRGMVLTDAAAAC